MQVCRLIHLNISDSGIVKIVNCSVRWLSVSHDIIAPDGYVSFSGQGRCNISNIYIKESSVI